MKIGIIGAGRIGKVHAETIYFNIPGVEVKNISDPYMNEDTKNWAKNLGISVISDNYESILNDSEIEAVLICSSTDTHAKFSIESADAKKHVFCEKPVDKGIDQIKKVINAAEKNGVKLQVGFNRRFDHNFAAVKKAISEKKIGLPHIIKITSRDPEAPPLEYVKVSGGIFFDMAIHDFDMARFLSNSEVDEIYAAGSCLINPDISKYDDIDTAVTTIKFKDGSICVIDNSRKAEYGYDQRVEVFGSKGSVETGNDTLSTAKISTADGIVSEKPLYFFLERYNQSFIDEKIKFFDAIRNNTEVLCNGNDGLQSVRMALAAKMSFMEKRSVKLDEIK